MAFGKFAFRLKVGRTGDTTPKSEILLGVVSDEGEEGAKRLALTNQSYTTELHIGKLGFHRLDVEIERVDSRQLSKKQRAEFNTMQCGYRDVQVLYQKLTHEVLQERFGTGRKPKEDC